MKIDRLIALTLLAATIAVSAGCGKSGAKTEAAAETQGTTAVSVFPAARQTVSEKLTYTGVLEAWRTVNITPETGGKVARILVDEGQRVAAGQLLAELDTESIGLQLRQAEAGLAVAEAGYENASRNKERMDRLIAGKAVSEQQAEQVKLGYDGAKAQLEQARAGVALARHAMESATMRAPWAGLVASKNAEVGDVVNPMMGGFGAPSGVVTLVDDSRIKVVVEVAPSDIARLQRGRPAILRVVEGEAKTYPGTIALINVAADSLSKKFRVEVMIDNAGRSIRPGTFGAVVFEVQSHENALAVPQKAILGGNFVFVAEAGKAVKKPVSLGLKNTTMIEVLSGLREGEAVIVEGNYGLIEGSPVEVKK